MLKRSGDGLFEVASFYHFTCTALALLRNSAFSANTSSSKTPYPLFIDQWEIRSSLYHHTPFLSFFDCMGSPTIFGRSLKLVFWIFVCLLLINRYVRVSSFMVGLALLISILSSRHNYLSSLFFFSLFFIHVGLLEKGKEPVYLRLQIGLVYLAAGLNKLLDADWRRMGARNRTHHYFYRGVNLQQV